MNKNISRATPRAGHSNLWNILLAISSWHPFNFDPKYEIFFRFYMRLLFKISFSFWSLVRLNLFTIQEVRKVIRIFWLIRKFKYWNFLEWGVINYWTTSYAFTKASLRFNWFSPFFNYWTKFAVVRKICMKWMYLGISVEI